MKAHVIENGIVVNTIVVESLDFLPNLVEATAGGIGWTYANGVLSPPVIPRNIVAEIEALEATITPRRTREAILGTDNGWLANVETQIAALRHELSA